MLHRKPHVELTKYGLANKFAYWHTGKRLSLRKIWLDYDNQFDSPVFFSTHTLYLCIALPIFVIVGGVINNGETPLTLNIVIMLIFLLTMAIPTVIRFYTKDSQYRYNTASTEFIFNGDFSEKIINSVNKTHKTELCAIGSNLYAEQQLTAPFAPSLDNKKLATDTIKVWLTDAGQLADNDVQNQIKANLTAMHEIATGLKNNIEES